MFNMKNTPLVFLEITLVILPAFVYGIPILPTVPLTAGLGETLPGKPLLEVGNLSLLPEGLEIVVPKVPISQISLPIEPVDVTEKLLKQEEKPLVVPAELKPEVQQLPLVDNVNLLPEKPNKVVHETPEPLAVIASFLHIDNVQVIIPGKLLEKIFSKKPIELLSVQTEPQGGVVGLPEKLEGIEQLSLITVDSLPQVSDVDKLEKPLHPLAVIATIPQIGNIQLVFSGELLKNVLSKTLISSVPVESKLEVVDDTILKPLPVVSLESKPQISDVTLLPALLTEKPFLLLPGESKPQLEEVVLQTTAQTSKGELLDKLPSKELLPLVPVESKPEVVDDTVLKPLPVVPVESKPQISDVTLLPGLLTEKPLLLLPGESKPQLEEVVLQTTPQTSKEELLDKLPSKELLPLVPVESKSEVVDDTVLKPLPVVSVESKPQISDITLLPGLLTEKPLLLLPGESKLQLEEVVLQTTPQTGNEELLDKVSSNELLPLAPVESKLNLGNVVLLPGVVQQKPLPSVPVLQGHDGDGLIPVELPSGVVNEISNFLPAVPTFTPLLELSAHEKLPIIASNE